MASSYLQKAYTWTTLQQQFKQNSKQPYRTMVYVYRKSTNTFITRTLVNVNGSFEELNTILNQFCEYYKQPIIADESEVLLLLEDQVPHTPEVVTKVTTNASFAPTTMAISSGDSNRRKDSTTPVTGVAVTPKNVQTVTQPATTHTNTTTTTTKNIRKDATVTDTATSDASHNVKKQKERKQRSHAQHKEKGKEKEVSKAQTIPSSHSSDSCGEVVFEWPYPGFSKVEIAGTFSEWERIELRPTITHQLTTWIIHIPLPPGTHQYKFVLDGFLWSYDMACPTVKDKHGNINNFIHIQ